MRDPRRIVVADPRTPAQVMHPLVASAPTRSDRRAAQKRRNPAAAGASRVLYLEFLPRFTDTEHRADSEGSVSDRTVRGAVGVGSDDDHAEPVAGSPRPRSPLVSNASRPLAALGAARRRRAREGCGVWLEGTAARSGRNVRDRPDERTRIRGEAGDHVPQPWLPG